MTPRKKKKSPLVPPDKLEKKLRSVYIKYLNKALNVVIARSLAVNKKTLKLSSENLDSQIEADLATWGVAFLAWHKSKLRRLLKFYRKRPKFKISKFDLGLGKDVVDGFIKSNVDLIKTFYQSTLKIDHKKVMVDIIKGHKDGSKTVTRQELSKKIQQDVGVSRGRANLWSRDQNSKLNYQLDREQAKKNKSKKYIWVTSGDSRVRPAHSALNGTLRYFGRGLEPSQDVNCRCTALFTNGNKGISKSELEKDMDLIA